MLKRLTLTGVLLFLAGCGSSEPTDPYAGRYEGSFTFEAQTFAMKFILVNDEDFGYLGNISPKNAVENEGGLSVECEVQGENLVCLGGGERYSGKHDGSRWFGSITDLGGTLTGRFNFRKQ